MNNPVSLEIKDMLLSIDEVINGQLAKVKTKETIEKSISQYEKNIQYDREQLDLVVNALNLLQNVSNESIEGSYKYIETNINQVLARIFPNKKREIKFVESKRGNYPQLELQLNVDDGYTRSLSTGTGHGVTQIISLLSNLCLIVINGGRRFVVLDEVLNGCSGNTLRIVDDVLEAFSSIGFQFIVVAHGYIPRNSKVIVFEDRNAVGRIVNEYMNKDGVYLDGIRMGSKYTRVNNEYSNNDDESDADNMMDDNQLIGVM